MKRLGWTPLAIVAALGLAVLAIGPGHGQQVVQYGFEARDPVFSPGPADAQFKELVHKLSDDGPHGGQRCEYLHLQVEKGSFIHYAYEVGRAPVSEELHVSLWARGNRPGLQILCRVVLPRERDPRNADQPLTVLVKGDAYQLVGRWQQLQLRQPVKRLREQQQLLRAELKRDVLTDDAYVDRVLINLYGGPGQTDVWIDDLEVGPVLETKPVTAAPAVPRPGTPEGPGRPTTRRTAEVQLKGQQLLVSGERFFLRGIRHTGTPLKTLRDAGFNTVWLDENAATGLVEDAVNLGFWIVPSVTPPGLNDSRGVEATLTSREEFGRKVGRFLAQEAVLCWDLGSNLGAEKSAAVSRTAQAFRNADPMRPLAADVWDGFSRYSRSVEMLGIHRWPLLSSLELPGYRDWLVSRRRLAQPGTYCWTWVQTHLPDWFTTVAYGRDSEAPAQEPIGPQAEQIRLLAYTAIGSGYRGLGFWSDRYLADSHAGRDRLLAMALLNQELQLLEPMLVSSEEPKWIDTSWPQVKAAVLRSDKGLLVLPVWMGVGAQFVPGQAASPELSFVVPQVPAGCQAWEVSPGGVRSMPWQRVVGGTRVVLKEFSMTAAVVLTSDLGRDGLIVRLQDQQRRMNKSAAQWAHDQAKEELAKVEKINTELEQMGHRVPDAASLLERSRALLTSCEGLRRNGDHGEAYAEAERALRPLRILMRSQWELALRESKLDTPTASPFAVSYFTLPRHWQFMDQTVGRHLSGNVLPDGDFESPPDKVPPGWLLQEAPTLDEVVTSARRITDQAHAGKQCLELKVAAKDPQRVPVALERTFLAIHSPAVKLPPGAPVRVSGWVKAPEGVAASADGLLFYDSAGGEPLAVRLSGKTDWKQFTLYRRVPASGTLNVTVALTGLGTVYFDDLKVEPYTASALPSEAAKPPAPAARSAAPDR